MSDGMAQLLLSEKAITIYEVVIIAILVIVLVRLIKNKKTLDERREISHIRKRNQELEKILKNPDNKTEGSKPPNPFDVQYKHNANNPVPKFQVGIQVHTEISVERYLFDLNQELTIGRDKKCTLPLNDRQIPKRSCSLFLQDQNVFVKALDTKNPPQLQRAKKTYRVSAEPVRLLDKDILILGKTSLHISLYDH